jgi:hypothetical protein
VNGDAAQFANQIFFGWHFDLPCNRYAYSIETTSAAKINTACVRAELPLKGESLFSSGAMELSIHAITFMRVLGVYEMPYHWQ